MLALNWTAVPASCIRGFAIQGKFETKRRNYLGLWDQLSGMVGDPQRRWAVGPRGLGGAGGPAVQHGRRPTAQALPADSAAKCCTLPPPPCRRLLEQEPLLTQLHIVAAGQGKRRALKIPAGEEAEGQPGGGAPQQRGS